TMNNKLRILPGLSPTDSIEAFYSKGIKEVYVGFYDDISEKQWPVAFNTINRRGEGGSFFGLKDFSLIADKAKKYGISIYVVFNVNYTKQQVYWILKSIKQVSKFSSVKGLIVNDINLLLMLQKQKYKKEIIISTLGTNLNTYAVSFYKNLGASRVVLDRQLTSLEILNVLEKFPKIQFEIFFLMADGCFFIDGYCTSLHVQETDQNKRYDTTVQSTLCMDILSSLNNKNSKDIKFSYKKMLPYKCNICTLYYLKSLKNITIKIPNRTITNSDGISIIDVVLKIEKELNKKNITLKQFQSFCKNLLLENKDIKCNPKICLCRDLYAKSKNSK
ncbi:MAG: U32 family peptidase, partial [Endomicrobiaceae bacterium]|nr:U32 family peptidase [Endomicrobiaceae bacterium]MDD3923241.1 U32 family peptidase [Endomicrobiaceae bacterium]